MDTGANMLNFPNKTLEHEKRKENRLEPCGIVLVAGSPAAVFVFDLDHDNGSAVSVEIGLDDGQ